jgi:hypothetical protein
MLSIFTSHASKSRKSVYTCIRKLVAAAALTTTTTTTAAAAVLDFWFY